MTHAFAFAICLIYQHQARDLDQQRQLQELFLAFLAGHLSAEQYERGLDVARDS